MAMLLHRVRKMRSLWETVQALEKRSAEIEDPQDPMPNTPLDVEVTPGTAVPGAGADPRRAAGTPGADPGLGAALRSSLTKYLGSSAPAETPQDQELAEKRHQRWIKMKQAKTQREKRRKKRRQEEKKLQKASEPSGQPKPSA